KPGARVDQLKEWIRQMFGWMHDAELRMHLTVIDSDEVRAAKGYRETRERAHADRERSLVEILRRGRADGTFPLADPERDAIAISAVIGREMANQSLDDEQRLQRALDWMLEFALRALGVGGTTAERRLGLGARQVDTGRPRGREEPRCRRSRPRSGSTTTSRRPRSSTLRS